MGSLADALARRQIRGAALDVMAEKTLPAASPLWTMEHVLITPHTAGEPAATRTMCSRSCKRIFAAALARRRYARAGSAVCGIG